MELSDIKEKIFILSSDPKKEIDAEKVNDLVDDCYNVLDSIKKYINKIE